MTTPDKTTEKVHVIRLLPAGNSPAARTERAHLQASKWLVAGAPGGEAVAGRAYKVRIDVAANLVRKGWTLCDGVGKPIDLTLPEMKPEMRNGTEEWYALPLDQRPGTEEYRAAELDRKLQAAYVEEQAALTKAHTEGAHQAATSADCPMCAASAAELAPEPTQDPQGTSEPPSSQGGATEAPATQEAPPAGTPESSELPPAPLRRGRG